MQRKIFREHEEIQRKTIATKDAVRIRDVRTPIRVVTTLCMVFNSDTRLEEPAMPAGSIAPRFAAMGYTRISNNLGFPRY